MNDTKNSLNNDGGSLGYRNPPARRQLASTHRMPERCRSGFKRRKGVAAKETSAITALIMTFVIIGVIIAGGLFAVKFLRLNFNSSRKFTVPQAQAPMTPSEELPVARGPVPTIAVARMAELRRWLEEERFQQLNSVLDEYQKAFEQDYTREFVLSDAYHAYSVTMPAYAALFDKWIAAYPQAYQPYLAAAHYYYARGWQSRGFKWRKDTTDEQINGMHINFSIAAKHLAAALKINPSLMPAYHILIGIHNANGEDQAEQAAIDKGVALFPYSYILWSTALWAREPRWGGSYRQMAQMAGEAQTYARQYPLLTALYGAAFSDLGRVYENRQAYDQALESFNRAISFGDEDDFYLERAGLYAFKLKDYTRALEDINHAIILRPTSSDSFLQRAKIYFAQGAYNQALDDLRAVDAIRPEDPSTHEWRTWASNQLNRQGHRLFKTDLEGALEKYQLSSSFDRKNHETLYWRGVARYKMQNYAEALTDFKECIAVDPSYFNAYLMLDYLLSRDGQWDAIIGYWNAFLKVDPNNAEAYFQRSGTHYHNHNLPQAKADLQKACDLGSRKACRQYQEVKNRFQ
jgi:tetratricopeptide (TPR) repeat protein